MRLSSLFILLASSTICFAETDKDGEYLVHAAGCADCHTASQSAPFAGGYRISTPFGIFYTPNITPDQETGIGKWTEENFRRALREGRSPGWKIYYPVFPYRSYTKMTDSDIHKIYLYLRSLTSVHRENRPHELGVIYGQRWLMFFWQTFFFNGEPSDPLERIKAGVGAFVPEPKESATWNRGAYLAEVLLHCAECHTPRDWFGVPENSLWMSGTNNALNGVTVPNITPDPTTGLNWNEENWLTFLSSGFTPKGETPGNEMAAVILNTSRLTKEDRAALVEYLRTLKPVYHFSQ